MSKCVKTKYKKPEQSSPPFSGFAEPYLYGVPNCFLAYHSNPSILIPDLFSGVVIVSLFFEFATGFL